MTSQTPTSPVNEAILFTISPEQKAKYDAQFKLICPSGDYVTGQQARDLMLKSGLSPQVLAHVWNLSDVDADGRMDVNEFSIALHLIALKLKGVELPQILPQSLRVLAEPPPAFAAFNETTSNSINSSKINSSNVSPSTSIQTKMGTLADLNNKIPPSSTSIDWAIPQQTKLKYTQLFNQHDRSRTGFLTGIQARNILLESKLPQTVLAQIWNLSDIDVDGKLTCDEFVVAMHFIEKAKRNESLPAKLPPELLPPSYRRQSLSHTSSFDDSSKLNDSNSMLGKNSFEDKRRENYEKGQAELDRRRQALLDQQRREREERERKEREENARKERERLDAERRKQEEIERQQQKLREQELEREEQKRRQQEVRDLARKEMERQRQRELELSRRTELIAQRSRLVEEVQKLKTRRKMLVIDHEKADKTLKESNKAAQVSREKVVRLKSDIDRMRIKRDEIMAKQSQINNQMKSLTEKQLLVEEDKVRLAKQLKSLIANTSNGVNPDQQLTNVASILQAKQSQINQLKSKLELIEQDFRTKKEDITLNKRELESLKRDFETKRLEARKFSETIEGKRILAEKVRDGKADASELSKASKADSEVVWGQAVPTNFEWPSEDKVHTTQTKFKYRCLYAFQARKVDELAIEPGDIIMVNTSACSEEGWLSGEINGKSGWFPKDYVELIQEAESVSTAISPNTALTEMSNDQCISKPASVARMARALYDLSSTESGHLSFNKGDSISITDQHDAWYYGELLDATTGQPTGISGWVSVDYVEILDAKSDATLAGQDLQYYVSLYAFESVEPGDLGFDVNELIKIEVKEGDWWTGVVVDRQTGQENPSRRGIFPSNYVGPASAADIPLNVPSGDQKFGKTTPPLTSSQTQPITAAKADSDSTLIKTNPGTSLDRKDSTNVDSSGGQLKTPKKSKSKKQQEIVQAIASYTASGPEQLTLKVGDLIHVRKKTQTGWWEGELQERGKKKPIGWFPASYIKPLSGGAVAATGSTSARSTPEPIRKSPPAEEPEIERVIALYTFKAQRDDDISFEKDDVIRVLSKSDPTWWRGQNTKTGSIGLFPSNHVMSCDASTTPASVNSASTYFDPFDAFANSVTENHANNHQTNQTTSTVSFTSDDDWTLLFAPNSTTDIHGAKNFPLDAKKTSPTNFDSFSTSFANFEDAFK